MQFEDLLAMSQRSDFIDWLHRQPVQAGSLDFRELLLLASIEVFSHTPIDAESFADGALDRFWRYAAESRDDEVRRGLTPTLDLVDKSIRRARWNVATLLKNEDSTKKRAAQRLRSRPEVLRQIDDLNEREYEALGCVSCELIGVGYSALTPRGDEGGVDFYALVKFPGTCHLFSGATGPIRIVGQTKKRNERVKVGDFRDFLRSLENVRCRHPGTERHVPVWFRAASGPVVGWFIAHAGLQSGALDAARDHGVVVADSTL